MYRYYEHYHKSSLSKSWSETTDETDKPLPQSLALFYDTVVSTLHTQVHQSVHRQFIDVVLAHQDCVCA